MTSPSNSRRISNLSSLSFQERFDEQQDELTQVNNVDNDNNSSVSLSRFRSSPSMFRFSSSLLAVIVVDRCC